ncbi:lysine--tRNA ligase [bacterium]|nr:lysine--tRNA ligase [bacterium]
MSSLENIREERIKKMNVLKGNGMNTYPIETVRTATLFEVARDFAKLSKKKGGVILAGRVMSKRGQGAIIFSHLDDGTGAFQILLKKDEMPEESFSLWGETVDVGDFIEATGALFTTKRGEKTLQVKSWKMLAKSLRPLPDKWHGLQDMEERYRRRYLDTLMSPEVKERFIVRSKIVSEIRRFFDDAGYMEVETPILQPIPGGASAKPFRTHHNALGMDLYLRIAPELYLKELLVGGFPKVYELGRLFRNEGIDVTHNPEFTTVEYYEAYSDAEKYMAFTEKLLQTIIKKILKKTSIEHGGQKIDFSKKFARVPYLQLFGKFAGMKNAEALRLDEIAKEAKRLGVEVAQGDTSAKILDAIYKKHCRPRLIQPTFLTDYPAEFSPLAKRRENNPAMIDRFQLVVGGYEIVNAFSELNDPIDQRNRFAEQERNRKGGDEEAQPKDEEYLEAMEYGMPPAAGSAISIDRLTMLLTDQKNIREVILFPTLRLKDEGG